MNADQEQGSVRAPSRGELQEVPHALNRSALSSGGLPFGEFNWRPDSKTIASMPAYDGLSFQPFARPFQHVDYVTQSTRSDVRESIDSETVQPFARHLARPPYSHHDESQAMHEFSLIEYDENSQTTIFPPGVVAGKGWCRVVTRQRWFPWRLVSDVVRD